jgi:hypothetical protein
MAHGPHLSPVPTRPTSEGLVVTDVPPGIRDTVRAGRRSRRRGKTGELEVATILRAHGWPHARRNWAEQPQGGRDILDGPGATWISVKRTERLRLREAFAEASAGAGGSNVPMVVHRCDGQPWLVTLELEELLPLLVLRERG